MTREEIIASHSILSAVQEIGQKYSHWGWAELSQPLTFHFYESWIQSGFHAQMDYLKEHLAKKADPQRLLAKAQTALVFAQKYHPFPEEQKSPRKFAPRSALYAQGTDYHLWFKQDLARIAAELKTRFPEQNFLAMTDSSPVMERDLAQRAGLGWFGKNSCLIDRAEGSLFFLGEIYSDFAIEPAASGFAMPPTDFCGTCTKCLDICPTQALIQPRVLDANKCISYWTIESRGIAPKELRPKIGDWFFGCDLCQTICPWNQKQLKKNPPPVATSEEIEADLRFILTSSNQQLRDYFRGFAMSRAEPFGLRRNAIIVAVNLKMLALRELISSLKKYEKLGELCEWANQEFQIMATNL